MLSGIGIHDDTDIGQGRVFPQSYRGIRTGNILLPNIANRTANWRYSNTKYCKQEILLPNTASRRFNYQILQAGDILLPNSANRRYLKYIIMPISAYYRK